jgi:hypothetical protein
MNNINIFYLELNSIGKLLNKSDNIIKLQENKMKIEENLKHKSFSGKIVLNDFFLILKEKINSSDVNNDIY